MSEPPGLAPGMVDAFARLCEGDFSHRLPRSHTRDEQDTAAFLFNAIAEELERIVRESREKELRLAAAVEKLSEALISVATGDFTARVPRDNQGDAIDVLAFLVNNTIDELGRLVAQNARRAEADRTRLEGQVAERTAQLQLSEENFRRLFDAAPVALLMTQLESGAVVAANARAAALLAVSQAEAPSSVLLDFFVHPSDRTRLLQRLHAGGVVDGFEALLKRSGGQQFWADFAVRLIETAGGPALLCGLRDVSLQKATEQRLRELATVDSLTEVLNRRRLFELAEEELARADRYQSPLSLAILDLDHFKQINDRFGHQQGDRVLRAVAKVLREQVRRPDQVGRYGGEEFVVVFPETRLAAAVEVVERIRAAAIALKLSHDGDSIAVTVSGGVVELRPGESLDAAFARADAALYEAKATGRNKVVGGF